MVVSLAFAVVGLSAFGAPRAPLAPAAVAVTAPADAPAASAPAVSAEGAPIGHIDVVQINGLIDPIEVDFLERAVAGADRSHAVALVVQLNSGGGVVSPTVLHHLTAAIAAAPVPVGVWVGPNGSRALNAAFEIFQAAPLRAMASGTRVGPLAGHTLDSQQAAAAGVTTVPPPPTVGDFIVNLDGKTAGDHVLHTAEVVRTAGQPRRQTTVAILFERLNLLQQLLHTAASPSVAYLMVLIGLLLIIMEFFTAGIGIGAFCGTGALILASYGLGVLPIRVWALLLLGVAAFGFVVDLQAGVPRAWSAFGGACLLIGSLFLYRGVHPSVLALAAGVLGTPLFMVAGMPALTRARFSTPTIGRQSLVGEMGVALASVEPEGTVEVRGAPWQARTNRATPIKTGDRIRVVAIDGLLLEVEPETGGAKDAHH